MNAHPSDSHLTGFRLLLPAAITAAFGACAAMLVTAYVLHLPGLRLPGPLVGVAMLLALAGGYFLILRRCGVARLRTAGLMAGFLGGLISLIALGSALKGEDPARTGLMAAGWVLFTSTLGAFIGGVARSGAKDRVQRDGEWVPRLGLITAASTLALLTMGGLVTAAQAGLAVPDWPRTFGANMFFYPLSKMTGGVYYEHAHRLMGAFVGLSTAALMALGLMTSKSMLVKALATVAFVHVCVQGLVGGLRVTETSVPFAVFHGVSAHVFLALLAVITLVSTRWWREAERGGGSLSLPVAALVILFVQIVFGAVARHFPESLHGVMTHAGFSLIAAGVVVASGARASQNADGVVKRFGKACVHTVGLQMVLGVAALGVVMMTRDSETPHAMDLALTTAHQVVGALLFSLMALMTVASARVAERG